MFHSRHAVSAFHFDFAADRTHDISLLVVRRLPILFAAVWQGQTLVGLMNIDKTHAGASKNTTRTFGRQTMPWVSCRQSRLYEHDRPSGIVTFI